MKDILSLVYPAHCHRVPLSNQREDRRWTYQCKYKDEDGNPCGYRAEQAKRMAGHISGVSNLGATACNFAPADAIANVRNKLSKVVVPAAKKRKSSQVDSYTTFAGPSGGQGGQSQAADNQITAFYGPEGNLNSHMQLVQDVVSPRSSPSPPPSRGSAPGPGPGGRPVGGRRPSPPRPGASGWRWG